jgi:hypothetical protein
MYPIILSFLPPPPTGLHHQIAPFLLSCHVIIILGQDTAYVWKRDIWFSELISFNMILSSSIHFPEMI